jgi:hypothetical protein
LVFFAFLVGASVGFHRLIRLLVGENQRLMAVMAGGLGAFVVAKYVSVTAPAVFSAPESLLGNIDVIVGAVVLSVIAAEVQTGKQAQSSPSTPIPEPPAAKAVNRQANRNRKKH